jgi:hypothetical protein
VPEHIGKVACSLSDKQEHDGVKCIASGVLENETGRNTDGIDTRQTIRDVDSEYAQADEEEDEEGKELHDLIQRLECLGYVTHATGQSAPFLVDFEKNRLDFCSGYVTVIVLVENAEGCLSFCMGTEGRVEIGGQEIIAARMSVSESHEDGTCQALVQKAVRM